MRLYSAGFLLLLLFTDSGVIKSGGDWDTLQECQDEWEGIKQCYAQMAKSSKYKDKDCFVYCGQPLGFCLQGDRLTAPGVIFPVPKKDATCD